MTSTNLLPSVLVGAILALFLGGAAWVVATAAGAVPREGVRLAAGRRLIEEKLGEHP